MRLKVPDWIVLVQYPRYFYQCWIFSRRVDRHWRRMDKRLRAGRMLPPLFLWLLHVVMCSTPVQRKEALTSLSKAELCSLDMDYSKYVLRLIKVAPSTNPYPRIFCFVNTISVHHETRVKAVRGTWGQRCHKLVFFSNATDALYTDIHKIDNLFALELNPLK
jgi:hypothetical protein